MPVCQELIYSDDVSVTPSRGRGTGRGSEVYKLRAYFPVKHVNGAEMAYRPREEDFSRSADGRSTWKRSTKTCDGVEMHQRAHKQQQQQHPCRCIDSTPGSLPACARAFPPRRYPVAMRGWLVTAAEAIWHLLRGDAALLQKQHTERGAEAARTASLSLPLRPACSSRFRRTMRPFAGTPRRNRRWD